MSTVIGTFTFGLPDNSEFDKLRIYSATSKNGTYSLDTTVDYDYPELSYEYSVVDETKWYKIQFLVNSTSQTSPISDPIPGSKFTEGKPFFAISSSSDGISYASTQDFYSYTNLTPQDVDDDQLKAALKKARAYIDLKMDENSYTRFSNLFTSSVSRRKYNATLELLKEVELNLAASIVFKNLSDDITMKQYRNDTDTIGSISVGGFSITNNSSGDPLQLGAYLMNQAISYASQAGALINMINSNEIKLHYGINSLIYTYNKFRFPWINW